MWYDEDGPPGTLDVLFSWAQPNGQPLGAVTNLSDAGLVQAAPAIAWAGDRFAVAWEDRVANPYRNSPTMKGTERHDKDGGWIHKTYFKQ